MKYVDYEDRAYAGQYFSLLTKWHKLIADKELLNETIEAGVRELCILINMSELAVNTNSCEGHDVYFDNTLNHASGGYITMVPFSKKECNILVNLFKEIGIAVGQESPCNANISPPHIWDDGAVSSPLRIGFDTMLHLNDVKDTWSLVTKKYSL